MDDGTRIKVCGLMRNADARFADVLGADFLGVVLSSGFQRSVQPECAASVVAGTVAAHVAVVVDESPVRSAELASSIGASVIQLHGDEPVETVHELRALGEWSVWKAVRAASIEDVVRVADQFGAIIDGLIVEGWSEGVVGGGGVRVRLDPSAVRAHVPPEIDFIIAGGLTSDSVEDAVARFRPDVVDVSSGIERSAGVKDPELVRSFFDSVRSARGHSRLTTDVETDLA